MLRYTSGGNYKIPAVVRGPGGVGRQLGAEHSQRLEAYFHAVPGIKIVACSTPTNAKGLMKAAIRDDNPVLFFEHVLLYNLSEELPEGDYTCALDQADIVKEGKDITLFVFLIDFEMVAISNGFKLIKSINSTSIPFFSNSSTALRQ